MKEPEKGRSELLVVAKSPALVDPTCEEGGDAKLREGAGANAGATTVCENGPADFCITEKKEGADSEGLSPLSVLAQLVRIGRPPKLNAELKSRVCFLLGLYSLSNFLLDLLHCIRIVSKCQHRFVETLT